MKPQAPIDPETGKPVRNWPVSEAPRKPPRSRDDKDPRTGEWTAAAVARYDNMYEDGSPLVGGPDVGDDE